MTEKQTRNQVNNHNSFSGILSDKDFSTLRPNRKRINYHVEAEQLPSLLSQLKENKEKEKVYLQMTLEELRENRLISNTNGRPVFEMTDKKWQEEFKVRKLFVTPLEDGHKRKMGGKYSKESSAWEPEEEKTYYGPTNFQEYCSFMNDILRNIRSGQVEYCYYIYQIIDLLRFHYDDLITVYKDGYWEVSLAKRKERFNIGEGL